MTSLEKDTLSRRRIVSDIHENFFVEAGAGSGKTTMLVNRMAAMVETGLDISRICAITFTKAAAGEFYDRFQKLLIMRSSPDYTGEEQHLSGMLPDPTDVTRERCRIALQNIDLCFMGTIDAFCGMVLSEHPSEARIPSDASIVSDEDAAVIYKQQYVRILQGEYGKELQSLAKTFQSLHRDAQDVFVRGISFVMNNRNVHFHYHEAAGTDIDKAFAEERKELISVVKFLTEHPELKYEGHKDCREAWEKIGSIYSSIRRRWGGNYPNLLSSLKDLSKVRLIPEAGERYAFATGSVFELREGRKSWLECTVGRPGGLLEKLQKLQYDVSMTFLVSCVPVMEEAFREKGCLTFFDDLYYLRNMLKRDAGGDGKLIRYIYDRHSYFLIDEFQDTNPLQAEVFFYLSAEHPVPQWSACVPRPGSLFIVGDPKQSIYRFRSADVASFLKVKTLFEKNGGSILTLSRNFRSTRDLCAYFNRVFPALLPEQTENQSKYEEIPLPEPADGEFQGVYSYTAYTGAAAGEYPDMADPVRIADIIERLAGNGQVLIRGEKEKELRPIRYSDFMVITYGKKSLRPIMAELDRRNIPAKVEGDVPFAENRALYELSRIYAAAADPEDTIALYGALTGGLIALSKEDLLRFRVCGGSVSLKASFDRESCSDRAALKAADAIDRLKELLIRAQRLSPAALYSEIMDGYRIYQTAPAENLEVVCYALELLRNAEKSGQVISLKDGAAFLRSLVAGESGEERCLNLTSDKDCVHMANLHKVKGLEAPVVILAASAASRNNQGAYRLVHGDDGSEGYIFSLGERNEKGIPKTHFSTPDYPDEEAAESEALRAEGDRLVYVAATRARNALILCNSMYKKGQNLIADSRWRPVMETGLPDIFEALGDSTGTTAGAGAPADAAELYSRAEAGSVLRDRTAETAGFKVENPSRLHVLSKLSESPEAGGEEAPGMAGTEGPSGTAGTEDGEEGGRDDAGGCRFAALLGTMTHKLMEMLVMTRNTVDAEAAIGEIIREYRTPATESYEKQLAETLRKAAGRIRNGGYAQTNGVPQDILGTLLSADEVCCEVPFCYKDETEENTVWNGIMDVVYSKDGRWHILDYKTSADGSDLDTRYQAQLSAYVRAFRATTGIDADAKTYHIGI